MNRRVVTAVFLATAVASCSSPGRVSPPQPEPGHTRLTGLGDWSEDPCPISGQILFARLIPGHSFQLWSLATAGPAVQLLLGGTSDVRAPAATPDGSRIAWSGNERGTWDIFTAPMPGDVPSPAPCLLAGSDDDETGPTWAPDGKRLAWAAFDRKSATWHLRIGDGTTDARDLGEGFAPSWHPDGERLVCQRAVTPGGPWKACIVDIATGRSTEICPEPRQGAITPSWSCDGRWVLFASRLESADPGSPPLFDGLWAVTPDGSKRLRLTAAGIESFSPRETADGRIVYCRREGAALELWSFKSPLGAAESSK